MADLHEAGPHHLRLAAERVGVLDLLAMDVRLADLALLAQQVAVGGGRGDLGGVARTACSRASKGTRLPSAASTDKAPATTAAAKRSSARNSPSSARAVGLCPVQQGQPFLGGQGDRFDAGDFCPQQYVRVKEQPPPLNE